MINSVLVSLVWITSYFCKSGVVCHHIEHVDRVVVGQEAHDLQVVVVEGEQVSAPLGFFFLHESVALNAILVANYDIVGVAENVANSSLFLLGSDREVVNKRAVFANLIEGLDVGGRKLGGCIESNA